MTGRSSRSSRPWVDPEAAGDRAEASASHERAVSCPRCGGTLEARQKRQKSNPFLTKSRVIHIVCGDCGLDVHEPGAIDPNDPWCAR